MRFFSFFLAISSVLVTVNACEGDCIVGITNAFLKHYQGKVHEVLSRAANDLSQLGPVHSKRASTLGCLGGMFTQFKNDNASYAGMENAIFPSFFHGKCQVNGVDPAGCPNPDCPVVCGTPGSLVHFYPDLRYIAFNQTKTLLNNLVDDNTQKVEDCASKHAPKAPRRLNKEQLERRSEDRRVEVANIVGRIPEYLLDACGGSDTRNETGLPDCSWEASMKKYILTFP